MEKILVVEDDEQLLEILVLFFQGKGYFTKGVVTAEEALSIYEDFDIVLSDIKLPGELNGIDLLERIKKSSPEVPVILITAYASVEDAVKALKMGAEDYILKPFDLETLEIVVRKALESSSLRREVEELRRELQAIYQEKKLVAKSPAMEKIMDLVRRIAPSDVNVLITGESGTGKTLLARVIHELSPRRRQKFVSINCAAIPEHLLESELFGHERGAFTGAVSKKRGLFEVAKGGTLFLDEISGMSLNMQAKLLTAIQDKKIRRVGGEEEIEVDVRIITATNQDIDEIVRRGEFREDLFYRLDVVRIELPPLRKRRQDIPLLVQHFIDQFNKKHDKGILGIEKDALVAMETYHWPGNIRELQNVVERAVVMETGSYITVQDLPEKLFQKKKIDSGINIEEFLEMKGKFNLEDYLNEEMRKFLKTAVVKAKGDKKKAAELLGISYRSFRYYWKKLGLG